MEDSPIGRGGTMATRMTRNSASLQSLQAAGHAAALADGLVGSEGGRSGGRPGAGTRSGTSHSSSSSRGIKHEVMSQAVERSGSMPGEREATSVVAATATGPTDTMLGVILGGGSGGGGGGGGGGQKKQKTPGLRRGKWTTEEEKYANRLIHEFKAGLLPLTDGTTLRTFLSIMLNCDPMRISKKFVGSNCIGKQVFRRQHGGESDPAQSGEAVGKSWTELADLERNFLERVAETTSKLKHGGGGAAAASGYGRSHLTGHDAGDSPPTRGSGATSAPASASAEQAGVGSRSGSWRHDLDEQEDEPARSDDEAGGKQGDVKMGGPDPGGQDSGSSLTTPALTTRQRKLRSRPQQNQQDYRRQQHHPQHPQHDARRDKVSQSLSRPSRNRGGKGTAVETHRGVENEEQGAREIGDPVDSASSSSRASLFAATNASSAKSPGVGGGKRRGVAQGVNSVRARKRKNSARRGKDEGDGKEAEAGDEDGKRDENGEGGKTVTPPAQQRRQHHKQGSGEQQRERQAEQQQRHQQELQELNRQREKHRQQQLQQQVLMQQQQQALVQQHAQHPQPQQHQVVIGNSAFGFDSDGGPVPRTQSLSAFPSNASLSGSLSVQNLAMLLGMSGAGAGLEADTRSGGGVAGGGGGGVVSNNFQAAADLRVAGAMRNTPSSLFLRSSFGQLTDLQVENVNLVNLQQHQQQQPHHQHHQHHLLHLPQHGPHNLAGADCGPGGSGVAMNGDSNVMGGANAMQVVLPHFFMGGRRTSAEDFLSLLQDSEELQAREAQKVMEDSEERSQSPITAAAGSSRLASSLSSGHALAPSSPPAATGALGGQLGKPGVMGRGGAPGGDVTDLSLRSARIAADASTSGGMDGVSGVCIRDDGADGRGKVGLSAFANGGVGGERGVGRGILVPGIREEAIVDDDNSSEDMYLVGETAEREEDEDEDEEDRVASAGDIAGPLSNGLRAGMGGGHLELKMGEMGRSMDQEAR